mmetsp:Transcript_36180/g.51169  ORF Transcript_36180/g.51169 Transcript_36180/m.51169 type:complete len:177 (+) Transcript_36180:234-764(+)
MSLSRVGRRIASAILILAACSSALVPFYRSTSIVSTRSSKSFNHYHGSKQHYHQQPQQHSLQTHHQKHKSRSNHALEMVYDSSGAVVAAAGAISGGLFAGGLHAIAGEVFVCFNVFLQFQNSQSVSQSVSPSSSHLHYITTFLLSFLKVLIISPHYFQDVVANAGTKLGVLEFYGV